MNYHKKSRGHSFMSVLGGILGTNTQRKPMMNKQMNERIKELLAQAGIMQPERFNTVNGGNQLEKFAELLLKDCTDITSGLSKLFPRTDVAFDVGYTIGTTRATKQIKEHFGVEE